MEELVYEEMGKRIRKARNSKEITQQALADLLGLTRTSVTNIEKGNQKIPVHVLYNLSMALEISPEDLLPKVESLKQKQNIKIHNTEIIINDDLNEEELDWIQKLIKDE